MANKIFKRRSLEQPEENATVESTTVISPADGAPETGGAPTPTPPRMPESVTVKPESAPVYRWKLKGEELDKLKEEYERATDGTGAPAWTDAPDDRWLEDAGRELRMSGDMVLPNRLRGARGVDRPGTWKPGERQHHERSAGNARFQKRKEAVGTRVNERGVPVHRKMAMTPLLGGLLVGSLVLGGVAWVGVKAWQDAQEQTAARFNAQQEDIAVVDLSDPNALVATNAPQPLYGNEADPFMTPGSGVAAPPAGTGAPIGFETPPPVPLNANTTGDPTQAYQDGRGEGLAEGRASGQEEGYRIGVEDGRNSGFQQGQQQGYNLGRTEGFGLGRQQGTQEGQRAGVQQGVQQGREQGLAAGRAAGEQQGRAAGVAAGRQLGEQQGRSAGYSEGFQAARAAEQARAAQEAAQRAAMGGVPGGATAPPTVAAPQSPLSPVPLAVVAPPTMGAAAPATERAAPAGMGWTGNPTAQAQQRAAPSLAWSGQAPGQGAAAAPANRGMAWSGGAPGAAPQGGTAASNSMAWSGQAPGQGGAPAGQNNSMAWSGGAPGGGQNGAAQTAAARQAWTGATPGSQAPAPQTAMGWVGQQAQAAQARAAGALTFFAPEGQSAPGGREAPDAPENEPSGGAALQAQQAGQSQAPVGVQSPYRPFQTIQATLYTSAIMIEGSQEQLNVIAQSSDGRRWVGTPRALGGGRMMLEFTQMIDTDGRTVVPLRAVAYDASGVPGLPAQSTDLAPDLVRNLIRSAATGVRDYAQAAATAGRTTVTGQGTVVQDRAAPNLWSMVAGRALGIFELPAERTFTRATYLPAGTRMVLMVQPD